LKPFEPKALLKQIERYATPPAPAAGVVAEDAKTRATLLLASRVARTDATVLLTGESGVGKEVFARYIHEQSARAGGPFVAINCAAIPDNLLEATLFGHEKGAFTGAQTAQAGKFEQANGGTLLLDEISEMPLGLQAKLLRVLQEREVERVGGKKPVPLDIRILATSNRDMAAEVRAGHFREDLFYRLNVFPLEIPSLRERPGDIVPLARKILAHLAAATGRAARFAADAELGLQAYAWPGNVRELENVVQRALILDAGDVIDARSLPLPAGAQATEPAGFSVSASAPIAVPPAPTPMPTGPAPDMKTLERQHIQDVLASVGGSRKKAVAILGISERTLRYKLNQYRAEGFAIPGDED
ncbi:MAG: sigma-54-dependent Fis family transcriptional regulator, partial [Sulfuritalea sp.]|nr:sigma-54-dependent Fis family transcriptional regulator [Sulfuritalea sp.]